jgi:hypothetical protein
MMILLALILLFARIPLPWHLGRSHQQLTPASGAKAP